MSLKNKLIACLGSTNPKQFTSTLKKNPLLADEVMKTTAAYSPCSTNESIYIILNQPPEQNECGKFPLFNSFTKGYRLGCGPKSQCQCARIQHSEKMQSSWNAISTDDRELRQKKVVATNLKKYGVSNVVHVKEVKEKIIQTNQQRYQSDSPFGSTQIREKIIKTNLERYDVNFPLQSVDIREKSQQTTLLKYGKLMSHARTALDEKYNGVNPFAVESVKEKIKSTNLLKYNRMHPSQRQLTDAQLAILTDRTEFTSLITKKSLTIAGNELGVNPTTISRYCEYYSISHLLGGTESSIEHRISTLLDTLNEPYIQGSKKIIKPLQLDFFLPDRNVAIEVGSLFYHSEINAGRGKTYHLNKWQQCRDKNIQLFQWFDDEIKNHWPVIENKIRYLTNNISEKIGARKIKFDSVDVSKEREFLENNHIQGFSSDRSFVIGGYFESQLISIMTFAKRTNYVELTRFATKLGSTYPGLFSKMISNARIVLPAVDIVSFSANCHSSGQVYKSSGFVVDHVVSPTYFYTKNYHKRLARNGFMKKKLLEKFPTLDSSKTEWELMQTLGYDRIWDAGKIAWRLTR